MDQPDSTLAHACKAIIWLYDKWNQRIQAAKAAQADLEKARKAMDQLRMKDIEEYRTSYHGIHSLRISQPEQTCNRPLRTPP